MKYQDVLDAIRTRVLSVIDTATMPRTPVLTIPITDPSLLELVPLLTVTGMREANVPTPILSQSLKVQSVVLSAGPLADGTTANTSTLFVGGRGVSAAAGFPLAPGQTLSFPACDLADIYVVSATATDVVRGLYFA